MSNKKITLPKNQEEIAALSDADLQELRETLTAEADWLRKLRQSLAREAEFRTTQPKKED